MNLPRLTAAFLFALKIAPAAASAQEPRVEPELPVLPGPSEEMVLTPEELPLLPDVPVPGKLAPFKLRLAPEQIVPVLPPLVFGAGEAAVKIAVKRFEFTGNTAFSKRELAKLVAPFVNRELTSEDLEAARVAITKHYIDAGYISSGALLPDQDVAGGVVRFQIVEGRLKEVDLHGNFWFRDHWLRRQLERAAGQPVNFNQLKTGLQLLRQNPGITQINAELKPGLLPGENVLHVIVKERHPFRLGLTLGNQRPPSVGEGYGEIRAEVLNLTGHNDPLELRWGALRWARDGTVEFGDTDNLSARYEFPVSPWGTTLAIHAGKNDASIVDETFAALGITSKSEEFGLTLRQPLIDAERHRGPHRRGRAQAQRDVSAGKTLHLFPRRNRRRDGRFCVAARARMGASQPVRSPLRALHIQPRPIPLGLHAPRPRAGLRHVVRAWQRLRPRDSRQQIFCMARAGAIHAPHLRFWQTARRARARRSAALTGNAARHPRQRATQR